MTQLILDLSNSRMVIKDGDVRLLDSTCSIMNIEDALYHVKKKDCKRHFCIFDIPKDQDIHFDIPVKHFRTTQSRNEVQNQINYSVAKFVAASSISANVACSPAMTVMIQEVCKIAVDMYRNMRNKSNCVFTEIHMK